MPVTTKMTYLCHYFVIYNLYDIGRLQGTVPMPVTTKMTIHDAIIAIANFLQSASTSSVGLH
jgi:hypothetical protein